MQNINIYIKNFYKALVRENPVQIIYYGVRYIDNKEEVTKFTLDEVELETDLIWTIISYMRSLTPREFINIFPINKEYDGIKQEMKDYFYTMNMIKALPQDKPIGANIFNFLLDYTNIYINIFAAKIMSNIDKSRELEGKSNLFEDWAQKNNIPLYRIYSNSHGKKFMVDIATGKSYKIREKVPRYLKILI